MALSEESRSVIAQNFALISQKIRGDGDLVEKAYVFSHTHGVIQRVFNVEYDPDLVLVHSVLQAAHSEFANRLIGIANGNMKDLDERDRLFDSLADAVEELGEAIRDNNTLLESLRKIAVVGYIGTSHGHYMFERGVVRI